ncbi:MAG: DMT family transporter [bacterium]
MKQGVCIGLLVAMNLFWAGSYAVVKIGLDSMDPLALVFWRVLIAFVVMAGWIAWRRPSLRIDLRDGLRIAGAGLLLAVSNILWVTGIDYSHATDASLLYVFEPIWGIILASIFLREKLRPMAIAGLAIVIVGLLRLSDFDFAKFGWSSGKIGFGNALVVIGLLAESFFSIILKPIAQRRSAIVVTAGVLLVTATVLAVPMAIRGSFEVPTNAQALLPIAYLSLICTVAGYTLWVAIMRHMPVGVMLFTIFIQPIAGPFIAAAALGESIDSRVLSGGALLIAGMAVAVGGHFLRSRRERRRLRADEMVAAVAPYANA